MTKLIKAAVVLVVLASCFGLKPTLAAENYGTIDPVKSFAWGENMGWINLYVAALVGSGQEIRVYDDRITGYAWNDNYGWIRFYPSSTFPEVGVKNDGQGGLSGYAWNDNVGWIDLTGVKIDPATGIFSGIANVGSSTAGRIAFSGTDDVKVVTDWRPTVSLRPQISDVILSNASIDTNRLRITITASNTPSQMMISDTSDFAGASWQDFAASSSYAFGSTLNGTSTVYVKLKNTYGESQAASRQFAVSRPTTPITPPPSGGGGWMGSVVLIPQPTLTSASIYINGVNIADNTISLEIGGNVAADSMALSLHSDFAGASWQAFQSPFVWKADAPIIASSIIYFKLKNASGDSRVFARPVTVDAFGQPPVPALVPASEPSIVLPSATGDIDQLIAAVKLNEKSSAVLAMQKKLKSLGFLNLRTLSGKYDRNTINAIAKYRKTQVVAVGDIVKINGDATLYLMESKIVALPFNSASVLATWRDSAVNKIKIKLLYSAAATRLRIEPTAMVRPGSRIIRLENDDNRYFSPLYGKLCRIDSAFLNALPTINISSVAGAAYYIDQSCAITDSSYFPNNSIIRYKGSTINYFIQGHTKRAITAAGFKANNYRQDAIIKNVKRTSKFIYSTGPSIKSACTYLGATNGCLVQ